MPRQSFTPKSGAWIEKPSPPPNFSCMCILILSARSNLMTVNPANNIHREAMRSMDTIFQQESAFDHHSTPANRVWKVRFQTPSTNRTIIGTTTIISQNTERRVAATAMEMQRRKRKQKWMSTMTIMVTTILATIPTCMPMTMCIDTIANSRCSAQLRDSWRYVPLTYLGLFQCSQHCSSSNLGSPFLFDRPLQRNFGIKFISNDVHFIRTITTLAIGPFVKGFTNMVFGVTRNANRLMLSE